MLVVRVQRSYTTQKDPSVHSARGGHRQWLARPSGVLQNGKKFLHLSEQNFFGFAPTFFAKNSAPHQSQFVVFSIR
jgi:hypothetical protein